MFDAYANNQINITHIYHTGTHIYQYFILLSCNAFIIKHTLHLNFIDFVKPIYIII